MCTYKCEVLSPLRLAGEYLGELMLTRAEREEGR